MCRHRGVWRRAEASVRNAFISMGRAETAVWGEFVRRVEGRASALSGGNSDANIPQTDASGVVPVVSSGTMSVPVSVQVEHTQDPMGSIRQEDMSGGMVGGAVATHHRAMPHSSTNAYHNGPSISNALGTEA